VLKIALKGGGCGRGLMVGGVFDGGGGQQRCFLTAVVGGGV
jgi:hypothetical protein